MDCPASVLPRGLGLVVVQAVKQSCTWARQHQGKVPPLEECRRALYAVLGARYPAGQVQQAQLFELRPDGEALLDENQAFLLDGAWFTERGQMDQPGLIRYSLDILPTPPDYTVVLRLAPCQDPLSASSGPMAAFQEVLASAIDGGLLQTATPPVSLDNFRARL